MLIKPLFNDLPRTSYRQLARMVSRSNVKYVDDSVDVEIGELGRVEAPDENKDEGSGRAKQEKARDGKSSSAEELHRSKEIDSTVLAKKNVDVTV